MKDKIIRLYDFMGLPIHYKSNPPRLNKENIFAGVFFFTMYVGVMITLMYASSSPDIGIFCKILLGAISFGTYAIYYVATVVAKED